MKKISIVVAATTKNGIGKNNTIPWKLKKDLAFFKKVTKSVSDSSKTNAVIMGRKTYESIPKKIAR